MSLSGSRSPRAARRIYGAVLLAAKAGQTYLGTGGLYASTILAGLTDVDAITLTLTELHQAGDTTTTTAAIGIALAATTNTIVKAGLALSVGGRAFGKRVATALGASLVAGGIATGVLWAMAP